MADQLYLSYSLRGFTDHNMIRHFERLLRLFPFSVLSARGATLRVHAVSEREPPVFERVFAKPQEEMEEILTAIREFAGGDAGVFLETDWDLWQFEEKEWKLLPSRGTLGCFGPGFEAEPGENVRIEFGIDAHYLPQPELPNHLFMARSNVRSLLHLVHELDRTYAAATRRLWTESGENFAERLSAAVMEADERS